MKTVFISSLALLLCLNTFAQSNYYKLSAGAGYGFTQSFTDLSNKDFERSAYGTLDYFFSPFFSLGTEFQRGKIKANPDPADPDEKMFVNSYKAGSINGKVFLGALMDYEGNSSPFVNAIKWLYLGGGAGIIRNDLSKITRIKKGTDYEFPGRNSSYELLVPVNLGINFYFRDQSGNPRFAVNLNVQSNITLGEGLDGYDDSSVKLENGSPDMYNFYSLGLKYHFGLLGISKKTL